MAKSQSVDIDPTEANSPVEIWANMDGLTESRLHEEYINRLTANRDLRIYITGNSETGVGKTTLAFALALIWDQHGWTAEKATLDSREYSAKFDQVGKGSVLILDEAEQALDKRRAMQQETIDIGHDFVTKRYKQVFGLMTLPTKTWLDPRISEDAADYWIQCLESDSGKPKGEARVYRLQSNEHYETNYTKRTEILSWPVLDWHPEFQNLDAKKRERLEGNWQSKYIPREEVEEMKENYWNKATKMARYHIVKAMAEHGISQTKIAEILTTAENVEGVSQSRVSHFVNSDDFEEVYKT